MERTRKDKAKELMEKFDGKIIVRTDGKLKKRYSIKGMTQEGCLILKFVDEHEDDLCLCPPDFTDDNWKEV